jgi:hypothetical protein
MVDTIQNGNANGRAGFFCITDKDGRYWTGRGFSADRRRARCYSAGNDPYAHAERAARRLTANGAFVEVTFCRQGSMRT